ncbi:hypothetical protein F4779DRAFT_640548 [Xylariaceae sp. FL0662B]|nr:hypothetical protein F4779DRAFT_640548 [Xylariaceae sp. FL0662B]
MATLYPNLAQTTLQRTNILDNGVFRLWPRGNVRGNLPVNLSQLTERPIHALTELQVSRERFIDGHTLLAALEWIKVTVPEVVCDRIFIPVPAERDVFGDNNNNFQNVLNNYAAEIDPATGLPIVGWPQPFFALATDSDYIMWPVDGRAVGDNDPTPHWVTIVAHLVRQPPNNIFNAIDAWTVVDPEIGAAARAREARVGLRFQQIMLQGRVTTMPASNRRLWVHPMNPADYNDRENFSSGLRSYSIIRTLVDRVTLHACHNRDYVPAHFWNETHGWFNADQEWARFNKGLVELRVEVVVVQEEEAAEEAVEVEEGMEVEGMEVEGMEVEEMEEEMEEEEEDEEEEVVVHHPDLHHHPRQNPRQNPRHHLH